MNNFVASACVRSWHAMTAAEVIRLLDTSTEKGLDAGEVASRLQKYGSEPVA